MCVCVCMLFAVSLAFLSAHIFIKTAITITEHYLVLSILVRTNEIHTFVQGEIVAVLYNSVILSYFFNFFLFLVVNRI